MAITECDVVIIGGGLAGAATAIALNKACPDLSIVVVEKHLSNDSQHASFDARALAISYGSKQLLTRWGIWSELACAAGAIQQIEVSDQNQLGHCLLQASEHKLPALGYVLAAQTIGQVVSRQLEQLQQSNQLQFICPADVIQLTQSPDAVRVELSNQQTIQAKLLIAADGANSGIRQKLSITQHIEHYQQTGITCNIKVEHASDSALATAFERFTPYGPMAMLPLPDNQYGLVWCQSQARAEYLLGLTDKDFLTEAQDAFGYRAGRFVSVSQRGKYPLSRQLAQQIYHHRCLLLANAAHAIHPIAGQGLNLGLRDIAEVVTTISQALSIKQDIGCYHTWSQYIQTRAKDVNRVASATDSLVRVFSNQYWPLTSIRNKALCGLNRFPSLNKAFARQAMGLSR